MRRRVTAIVGVLAAGAALRIAAILTVGAAPLPHGDEIFYVLQAAGIAEGRHFPDNEHPPGQSLFLAAAFRVFGAGLQTARFAQVVPSVLVILLVFLTVEWCFGFRAALLSAIVCAANPTLIHHTHFLWPETLYSALLMLALWAIVRAKDSTGWTFVVVAGASLGLAALTKEHLLAFVPVAAAYLAKGRGTLGLKRAAAVVAVCAVFILPWTARNVLLHGSYSLVSNNPWRHLALSVAPKPGLFLRHHSRLPPAEGTRYAREVWLQRVRELGFLGVLPRPGRHTAATLRLDGTLATFAAEGWLPAHGARYVKPLIVLEAFSYVVLVLLAIAAAWLLPDRRLTALVASYCLFDLAIHSLGGGQPRYRVPLLPVLSLLVGPLLWSGAARAALPKRALLGAFVCWAAFACAAFRAAARWWLR